MTGPASLFIFDLTDPLSYLMARALVDQYEPSAISWTPFELRPPPTPIVRIGNPSAAERWAAAERIAEGEGVTLARPDLVPWSRKAHELCIYAHEGGVGEAVTMAVFEAYCVNGLDIGRVDVLVEIGRRAGLDLTETKAVLDVDRYEASVVEARSLCARLDVADVPTLITGDARLEGYHNRSALGTFLPWA